MNERRDLVFAHILEALTQGLYPNTLEIAREYIQNAYDAIREDKFAHNEPNHEIRIESQGRSLFIRDNGTGIPEHKMPEYKELGYSQKTIGQDVGFRGIGKYSGLTIANQLIVTSSVRGSGKAITVIFDASAMRHLLKTIESTRERVTPEEIINKMTEIHETHTSPDGHFTLIELADIIPAGDALVDFGMLGDYISLNAPVDFHDNWKYADKIRDELSSISNYYPVKISLNGVDIRRPNIHDLKEPRIFEVCNNDGDKMAQCWAAENSSSGQIKITGPYSQEEKYVGITFRLGGFVIGDNYLPRRTFWKYNDHFSWYFYGDIHVLDSEIRPSSDRSDFEDNNARNSLYKNLWGPFGLQLHSTARKSSEQRRVINTLNDAEDLIARTNEEIENKTLYKEFQASRLAELARHLETLRTKRNAAPKDRSVAVDNAIAQLRDLITRIQNISENGKEIESLPSTLGLSDDNRQLLERILNIVHDVLSDRPDLYERILQRIATAFNDNVE